MPLYNDFALNEGINLSQSGVGQATATLSSSTVFWSDVSGIRKGYRIIVGDGIAVLNDDPQFQSNSVDVTIVSPFTGTSFTAGAWELRVPITKEVKDYLPKNAKNTNIIPDYLDSLQKISIDEIQDAITRLRNLRKWDRMDQDYLDLYLQTMGMFFKSEQFDIETRRRFIKELPAFLELKGTRFFNNYLGFVIGALFTVTDLWSNDYKQFIKRTDIPGGDETGWYQTNHVELEFDANFFGILDVELIVEIFYVLASTPLVLQRIIQSLSDEIRMQTVSVGGLQIWYTGTDITP